MTVLAPEFLQTTKYSAQRMRQMQAAAGGPLQEGIVNFGDFKVSQRGAGANMSVDVAAGDAWVQGDNTARQGTYHVGNDGTVNVAVPAAHATLPRIDQVVLRIYDSTVIGGEKDLATVEVVSGTATAGATLSNLTGVAALPSSAIRLAYVLVGAAVTKIETANLGNLKDPRAGLTGYPAAAAPLAIAGAPPQYAMGRPANYVPAVKVRHNANQALAARAAVAFNTEIYDLEEMHGAENSKLICNTPGFYLIRFAGQVLASVSCGIGLNGTAEGNDIAISTMSNNGNVVTAHRLTFNDFIQAWIGATTLNTTGTWSPNFEMIWMGP